MEDKRAGRPRERGSALMMILVTTASLAVVLMSLAGLILTNASASGREVWVSQARYAAEAGVYRAMAQLKRDGSFTGEVVNLPGGWTAKTEVMKTGLRTWRVVSRAAVERWQVELDADVRLNLPPAFDYAVYGDRSVEILSAGVFPIRISGNDAVFSNHSIDIVQWLGEPAIPGRIGYAPGALVDIEGMSPGDVRLVETDPVPMPRFRWDEAKELALRTGQYIDPPEIFGRKLVEFLPYVSFEKGPVVYVDGDVASLVPNIRGSGVLVVNGDAHIVLDSLDHLIYNGNWMIVAKGEIHFLLSTGLLDLIGGLLGHPPVFQGIFFSEKEIESTVYPIHVEGALAAPKVRLTLGGTRIVYNRDLLENIPVTELFEGGQMQVVRWAERVNPVPVSEGTAAGGEERS